MTVMRERRRARRRGLMIVAGVPVLFLGSGAAGYAWWQVQGNTTINISAAKRPEVPAGNAICTDVNGGVRLKWKSVPQATFYFGFVDVFLEKNDKYLAGGSINTKEPFFEYTYDISLYPEGHPRAGSRRENFKWNEWYSKNAYWRFSLGTFIPSGEMGKKTPMQYFRGDLSSDGKRLTCQGFSVDSSRSKLWDGGHWRRSEANPNR